MPSCRNCGPYRALMRQALVVGDLTFAKLRPLSAGVWVCQMLRWARVRPAKCISPPPWYGMMAGRDWHLR